MSEPELKAITLDYSDPKLYIPSEYKFTKVFPQQDLTAITNTSTTALFEIPSGVYNLYESSLNFSISETKGGASNYNIIFRDLLGGLDKVEFYTRGTNQIINIDYAAEYIKSVCKMETKLSEYLCNDRNSDLLVKSNVLSSEVNNRIQILYDADGKQAQVMKLDGTTAIDATGIESKADNAYGVLKLSPAGLRYNLVDEVDNPITECKYLEVGTTLNDTGPAINYKIKLGDLKSTGFESLNRSLLFNEVMMMKLTFRDRDAWGFINQSRIGSSTPAVFAGNITMSNLALFVAYEQNQQVIDALQEKVLRGDGIHIPINFNFNYKTTTAASASVTISQRCAMDKGERLLKIYHSVYHQTEALTTRHDTSNVSQAKVVSFNTMLDSKPLQNFLITCSSGDDYMILKPKLRGSVIQSLDMYNYNWCWLEDFSHLKREEDKDGNVKSGLPLDKERKWDFVATMSGATAFRHYDFVVAQRMLHITRDGIITK